MRTRSLAVSLQLSLLSSLGLLPAACGGAATGSTAMDSHKPACSEPTPTSDPSVISCKEGYTYRKGASTCSVDPALAMKQRVLPKVMTFVDCTSDATICDGYQFAHCAPQLQPSTGMSSCVSGCAADEDCGPGGSCRCSGSGFGECAFDACNSDADCAEGYHCASYPQGCGNSRYACQTAKDACSSSTDCTGFQFCLEQSDGHRACGPGSVCGRPFLVKSEARVAPVEVGGRWGRLPRCAPRLDGLSLSERTRQAEHWTRMGQMEHASIAAFARFNLQLLSLGAPAELIEACNRALIDETNHAQLCFGLASAYAGRAIGPGPLDISMSLEQVSLLDVVDLVLAEGCFGETSAALEALELHEIAKDPAIREAYRQIADDEQRHAELAFRFIAWALDQEPRTVERIEAALRDYPTTPELRDLVGACFDALLERRVAA